MLVYTTVMQRIFAFALVAFFLTMPTLLLAQVNNPSGGLPRQLVPCTGADCNWTAFLTLMQNLLNFLVFLGVTLSALLFAYAGFLYLTSGGGGQVEEAKNIFTHVIIGLIIMLVAWLLVDTILKVLTGKGFRERNILAEPPALTLGPDFDTLSPYDTESPRTIG